MYVCMYVRHNLWPYFLHTDAAYTLTMRHFVACKLTKQRNAREVLERLRCVLSATGVCVWALEAVSGCLEGVLVRLGASGVRLGCDLGDLEHLKRVVKTS